MAVTSTGMTREGLTVIRIQMVAILLASALGGCGTLSHDEIGPSLYAVHGSMLSAAESSMDRESRRACPNGYEKLIDDRGRVAEGPFWYWRIRCQHSS